VYQFVARALAGEVVVAPVERVVVDATQALAAAVAEFRRPLGTAVARLHCLVERAETTSLNLFTGLGLQVLVSAVLRVRSSESGRVMRWVWMCARSSVRIRVVRTRLMLGIGMCAGLRLRLGFHVDSS
jgi:hypothetical protein